MVKKRNNGRLLEQLVWAIQETIKDVPSTTISTNKPIKDNNGIYREFDVVVESIINGINLQIVFECKDYSKQVDVKIVDAFLGKCVDIPNINKKVLVSTNGFSKSAREKALKHDIILSTIKEFDIKSILNEVSISLIVPKYEVDKTCIVAPRDKPKIGHAPFPFILYDGKTNDVIDFKTILETILYKHDTIAVLTQNYIDNHKEPIIEYIPLMFDEGDYAYDISGTKVCIDQIIVSIKAEFGFIETDIQKQRIFRQGKYDVRISEHGLDGVDYGGIIVQANNNRTQVFLKYKENLYKPEFFHYLHKKSLDYETRLGNKEDKGYLREGIFQYSAE